MSGFVNTQSGGMDQSSSDVCKNPPVGSPSAHPNIANGPEAVPNVLNINYVGGPVHNMNTITPVTHNDEGGSQGGVASGSTKGSSMHVTGSFTTIIQGAPVTRGGDINMPNNNNTAGSRVVPSQIKVQNLRP